MTFNNKITLRAWTAKLAFVIGLLLLGKGLYMDVKAELAQILIAHSWQSREANAAAAKPWWWADTKAIATLEVPRLNKRLFVMQDDSGESLAFGPGHLNASEAIAQAGHVMIAGHRDSHFRFLKELQTGDLIQTTNANDEHLQYRVIQSYILDTRTESLMKFDHNQLTLITCYPFDSVISGGPLRYIVNSEPVLKKPLVNQTTQPHQPSHYSQKHENTAHSHAPELAIADT